MEDNGNFYDSFALEMLRRIRFDKCFITSAACTASFGLSIQTARSLELTSLVIENSRMVVGMYPSSKLGRDSIMQICPAKTMNVLVTDTNASDSECAALEELGVKCIFVNASKEAEQTEETENVPPTT